MYRAPIVGFDMNLPHCQLCEEISPAGYIGRLLATPNDEIYIAVSRNFYAAEDYELCEAIYPRYKEHYLRIARDISISIGSSVFAGDWQDEGFPEWTVGEHVTVWKHNGAVFWLRIHHEDRECPIVIAIAAHVE